MFQKKKKKNTRKENHETKRKQQTVKKMKTQHYNTSTQMSIDRQINTRTHATTRKILTSVWLEENP